MADDSRAVYVAVCGRVERIDVAELSLEGLCAAVSARFDIGDRLRFISDEEGEPEVTTDEHLQRLAQQRLTLRVLIGDTALSDLEQRMWQLRQLQWGFFQDELARVKNHQQGVRNEMRQLRTALEQSARREVELTGELMNERRLREKSEQATLERHEALCAELRREQRARDTTEASLRKDLEDARQAALKFAANAERQNSELKGAIIEESRNRGKNIEALLAEWASSQAEIRQAMENVGVNIERGFQDAERQAKGLLREASAREAFEQFFGEKIRSVELVLGKFEGAQFDLSNRVAIATQEAQDAKVGDQALRAAVSDLKDDLDAQKAAKVTTTTVTMPPTTVIREPIMQQSATLSSSMATVRQPSPSRCVTPPPGPVPVAAPGIISSVAMPQVGLASPHRSTVVHLAAPATMLRSGSFPWTGAS